MHWREEGTQFGKEKQKTKTKTAEVPWVKSREYKLPWHKQPGTGLLADCAMPSFTISTQKALGT